MDDSYLRDMLAVDMDSSATPLGAGLFDAFVRSAGNSKFVQSPIARSASQGKGTRVQIYSPGGIYLGKGLGLQIPNDRALRIFSTIVRGLHWYYRGLPLPPNVEFKVMRQRDVAKIDSVGNKLRQFGGVHRLVGDGEVFQCVFNVADDQPDVSLWLLCFYRRVVFVVGTRYPDAPASFDDGKA